MKITKTKNPNTTHTETIDQPYVDDVPTVERAKASDDDAPTMNELVKLVVENTRTKVKKPNVVDTAQPPSNDNAEPTKKATKKPPVKTSKKKVERTKVKSVNVTTKKPHEMTLAEKVSYAANGAATRLEKYMELCTRYDEKSIMQNEVRTDLEQVKFLLLRVSQAAEQTTDTPVTGVMLSTDPRRLKVGQLVEVVAHKRDKFEAAFESLHTQFAVEKVTYRSATLIEHPKRKSSKTIESVPSSFLKVIK